MLGVRGRTPGLPHHSIWFPHDYRAEFADVFDDPRPPTDPAIYLCNPAATDPSVAPEGDEAWFVLVNAPRQGPVDWDREAPAYVERLLDRLDALGLDARRRLVTLHVRSPADLERQTGTPGGAIYGTAPHGPARGVPASGQRVARAGRATSSAARHTRAAGCRWSCCRPGSWPRPSLRPVDAPAAK